MTDWTTSIELPAAVNVMALQVIADAVQDYTRGAGKSYPQIGDDDWRRIADRARELARPPSARLRHRADTFLARRQGDTPGKDTPQ